jgi:hypothetical protein
MNLFFENIQNPAHGRRAGAMRQFPSNQLDSIKTMFLYLKIMGQSYGGLAE